MFTRLIKWIQAESQEANPPKRRRARKKRKVKKARPENREILLLNCRKYLLICLKYMIISLRGQNQKRKKRSLNKVKLKVRKNQGL